jgi:LssY C-terminus
VEIGDEATLRTALEELPCCATVESGAGQGPPLNLVVSGNIEGWAPAFARRNYRYAPARPRYAFGRAQDLSGHKISRWVAPQPHHLRAWLTPLRYQGGPIWAMQVSTGLGGRFAASGEATQRIEPDVDEARNDVVQDLVYSQAVARIGFVKGAGRVSAAEPRWTPDGSPYCTDGLRAVLMFGGEAVSLAEVDFFDWERLVDHYRPPAHSAAAP